MASSQTMFTLDEELAERARRFDVDIAAAAREGVAAAVRRAMAEQDRAAYGRSPEEFDTFWDDAQVWA